MLSAWPVGTRVATGRCGAVHGTSAGAGDAYDFSPLRRSGLGRLRADEARSSLGENIAAGYPTIDAVMTGWMASDGHCANLMNPNFNQVGLVCVPGTAADTYNTYWTMDLARSR